MTETRNPVGRPPLNYGPRHTVAVKLSDPEWKKLQEIALLQGIQPGPLATEWVIDTIRSVDLENLRTGQETLFTKAS